MNGLSNIGPSRRQLQSENEQLKRANTILEENLKLRQHVEQLQNELAEKQLPAVLTSEQVIEIMQYGNNKGYKFIKDLEKMGCPVVWYGREPRISREAFFNWLNTGGWREIEKIKES